MQSKMFCCHFPKNAGLELVNIIQKYVSPLVSQIAIEIKSVCQLVRKR